ncbi:MAG: 50S ribosomal protein L4 [Firmicutes bacterium]|nr:50S ribosomal protein L4 [Bacillota bacterium]
MDIKVYKQNGAEAGVMSLSDAVFGAEVNEFLIHEAVVAQTANKRQGTKSALTRAEVRGGGKKPWRQKKTGRARQGSNRSPQWTGGGVVFAPKPRSFRKKVNKTAMKQAIVCALSAKARDGEIIVLDSFELTAPKTREVAALLNNLKLESSVLLVYKNGEGTADYVRAGRNIPALTISESALINVYDLIRHNKIVLIRSAAKAIEEAYAS